MKREYLLYLLLALLLSVSTVSAQTGAGIGATAYDLGEAIVVDSALANLEIPLRLQGVIALPNSDEPRPLIVVLHGRHGICDGNMIAEWPCPDDEVRFDLGFSYLLDALAQRGYAVLALNVNAAMTPYFGNGDINSRVRQIYDMHLAALETAVKDGSDTFGVPLQGRVDLSQIALVGHSSGGGAALQIARDLPEAPAALLLIAAAYNAIGPEGLYRSPDELFAAYSVPSQTAVATILPDCDGDQTQFLTQFAYEAARFDMQRAALATSVRVFGANHNNFNTNATRGDRRFGYPPCFGETSDMLPPEQQRAFLENYAGDFFDTVWGQAEPDAAFDITQPVPDELYGVPVQTNLTLPAAQRRVLFYPRSSFEADILESALGGPVQPNNTGMMVCGAGTVCYAGIVTAGRFGHLRFTYSGGTQVQYEIPPDTADVRQYDVLHVRVTPDYLSRLNTPGTPQAFGLTLTDRGGGSARVDISGLAALQIPEPAEYYGYEPFLLYPASVRIPLTAFAGVDLSQLAEVALNFDVTGPGALLMADLEFMAARAGR
jgi:dienelactone hydrolase